ncbi:hypothetical protein ACYSNR_09270 [Enterococcus sp. LJL128]
MSGNLIKNAEDLQEAWGDFENNLFNEIDQIVRLSGIDVEVHEWNIHEIKEDIGMLTSASCMGATELFEMEYSELGMEVSYLEKLFNERHDDWINNVREELNKIIHITKNMK